MTEHPTEVELVRFAFADTTVGRDGVPLHLVDCAGCRRVIGKLRTQANALRLVAVTAMDTMSDCLDSESIAAVAEGSIDSADAPVALAHLLACGRCCQGVASVARLLDAPAARSEVDRLSELTQRRHRRRLISAGVAAGAGALAAGLLFMLGPASSQVAKPRYREESLTGAAAPRLVAPLRAASSSSDAFRWTSVPRADRYRITVFARDGSVVWEAQTRDTAIVFPELVRRVPNDTILWRVEAHVGWEDRWASSDLAMLTVHRAPR